MQTSFFKQFMANAVALFGVWLILSGQYDPLHLILGIILCCGVSWLNTGFPQSPFHHFPWSRMALYIPWLLLRIVESSWHLTKLILTPALPIEPKLMTYRFHLTQEAAIVLLGNTITLTPGTITVEVNSHDLLIHTIDETSAEEVMSGRMEKKIAAVFREQTGG